MRSESSFTNDVLHLLPREDIVTPGNLSHVLDEVVGLVDVFFNHRMGRLSLDKVLRLRSWNVIVRFDSGNLELHIVGRVNAHHQSDRLSDVVSGRRDGG